MTAYNLSTLKAIAASSGSRILSSKSFAQSRATLVQFGERLSWLLLRLSVQRTNVLQRRRRRKLQVLHVAVCCISRYKHRKYDRATE